MLVSFCFVPLAGTLALWKNSAPWHELRFEFKLWLPHFLAASLALFYFIRKNKDCNIALQGGCENYMK